MPKNITDLDSAMKEAMEVLEGLQSYKKTTTIRMMGYILIKILKSKLHGLYVNEQKLILVIIYKFIKPNKYI